MGSHIRPGEARALFCHGYTSLLSSFLIGALLKAKTFIDTVVYRSAISGESWAYVGLVALGFSLTGVVIVTMPVSTLGWLGLGWDDDNPGVTKTHSSVTFQEIQPSFSRIQGTEHNHCWNPAHSCRTPFSASSREQRTGRSHRAASLRRWRKLVFSVNRLHSLAAE